MTPDILREIEAIGGRVWLESERVKYRLPVDRRDLLDRLRERKAEIVAALATPAPLSAGDLATVTHWLDAINETDPAERARVIARSESEPRALAYVLDLAGELLPPPAPPHSSPERIPTTDAAPDTRLLVQRDQVVRAAAHDFHGHLFGPGRSTGCCYARGARYCPEGARLREACHRAATPDGPPR